MQRRQNFRVIAFWFWGFQLAIFYTDYEVYLLELVFFDTRKFDKFDLRFEISHDHVFMSVLTEISTFYKSYQSTDSSEQFCDWFKYLKMIQIFVAMKSWQNIVQKYNLTIIFTIFYQEEAFSC